MCTENSNPFNRTWQENALQWQNLCAVVFPTFLHFYRRITSLFDFIKGLNISLILLMVFLSSMLRFNR